MRNAMPALTVVSNDGTTIRVGIDLQPSQPHSRAAAAILPLALLALAGVSVLALRRRQLRSQTADGRHSKAGAGETRPLVREQACEQSGLQHDGSPTAHGGSCHRRHRIERMLRSQMSQPRQGIELVPLQRLPAGLAHQLGSMRHARRPISTAAAAADLQLPAYSQLQPVWEGQQHGSWGGFSSSTGQGRAADLLGGSAARPPASRQWGLETDSLRLAPGELELCTGPSGTLCLLGEGSSSSVYLGRLGGYEDVAIKVS